MRRTLIASSLLLVAGLAACGSETATDPDVTTFGPDDGSGVFASALLQGTLTITDGCPAVVPDEGGDEVVLAFADGTVTVEDGVLSYRDQELRSGDAVSIGGGQLGTDGVTLGQGCDEGAPVWYVDPNADLAAADPPRTSSYEAPTSSDAAFSIEQLQGYEAAASGFWYEETLADHLPSTLWSIDGAEPEPRPGGVVVGTVASVRPGQAFGVPVDEETGIADAPSGTPAGWDDPDAAWRVAVVTLDVDAAYGADVVDGQIRVGATLTSRDPAREMAGIEELGDVVVVLDDRRDEWDPDLRSIARSTLLGDVDAAGQIGFPALDTESAAFVGDLTTVDALTAAATGDEHVVAARIVDGQVERHR